jgi:hypothetical protein
MVVPSRRRPGLAESLATNAGVTIPDTASLDLTTGMTLEAWVYPTSLNNVADVIYKDSVNYYLVGALGAGTGPALGGAFAANPLAATNVLALNTWSHLAGTYDGTTMQLYVNGVLVSSAAQTGNLTTSLGALMIGGNAVSPGKNFMGKIDEVRIYNRALGASEIQLDMNTPVVGGVGTKPTRPTALTFR